MPRRVTDNYQDPRTVRARQRIIDIITNTPSTNAAIAENLSISATAVHYHTSAMLEEGAIHVSGYLRTGGRAFRLLAAGPGDNAKFVPLDDIKKPRVDMTEINCKVIVDLLASPMTVTELACAMRCSDGYVRKYIDILLAERPRRIYIKEWRRPDGKGSLTRVFIAGTRGHAKRPVLTAAERAKETRSDPEKHARALALRRIAAARRRTRNKPVTPFSPLGL